MQSLSSFLPSDEQLYERSKDWANFLSRIVKEETYRELSYDELNGLFPDEEEEPEDADSETEVNTENKPPNGCRALVRVEKFEASSSSSDDFDHENLLNDTLNVIEERKRKWKESGMDRILDTFDFNAITDKVGSWLRKTKQDTQLPSDLSMHEVHYENHQYELNSDDSMQSADTAKYILSNRKPRVGSCTKMIIKRFRYVKGKQELQKKFNCLNQDSPVLAQILNERDVFGPKHPSFHDYDEYGTPTNHNRRYADHRKMGGKTVENGRNISGIGPLTSAYKTPKTNKVNLQSTCKTTALTHERKNRIRFKKRRSDVGRRRSTSRSSSCDSDLTLSQAKPRFRKFCRKEKKAEVIDLSILPSSDNCQEIKSRPPTPPQKPRTRPKTKTNTRKEQTSDVTCFSTESIINSTAIRDENNLPPSKAKTCRLSPVPAKPTNASETIKAISSYFCSPEKGLSGENTKRQVEPRTQQESLNLETSKSAKKSENRIVLYNPGEQKLYKKSISDGWFVLTKEYLRSSVGEKQAERYILFNEKRFPMKFDVSSTVYFEFPTESENSEGDEEDVFNLFENHGKVVERSCRH